MLISHWIHDSLSRITVNGAVLSIRFASMLKSVPFEIQDTQEQSLYVRRLEGKVKRLLWYLVTAASLLYAVIQCIVFSINILGHGFTTDNAMHSLIMIRSILCSLFFMNNVVKIDGIMWEINQLSKLMEADDSVLGENKWYAHPFSIFAANYVSIGFHLVFIPPVLVIMAVNPNTSFCLYSVVKSWVKHGGRMTKFVCYFVDLARTYWSVSIVVAFFYLWCFFIIQNNIWLTSLRTFKRRAYESRYQKIDRLENQIKIYRQLYILNVHHNDNSRHFVTGVTAVFTLASIICIYGSLRAYGRVHLYVYPIFPIGGFLTLVIFTVMYPFLSRWESLSAEFLRQLRSEVSLLHEAGWRKLACAELRHFKPLQQHLSHVNPMTLAVPRECVEQIINTVILLLSF